jgi:hypothetical protein
MKLALIFNKERSETTGTYFERACQGLGIAYDHWWLRDASSIPHIYDLYIRIDHGDDYLVRLPRQLHPAVFVTFDTHLRHSWRKIRQTAPWYDSIFCCHRDGAARLPHAQWLPVACDPGLYPQGDLSAAWDLAFVGTDGAVPRKFYLQALRERYPNSFIGRADYRQLGSIYARARIGFNYSIANDVNMRIFEILAANTLLLTNALRGDDLRRLGLEDRMHLILYHSPQELLEQIDYFLAHPDERQRIAQAGGALVRERHTYVHRMKQLLNSTAQRLGVPRPAHIQEFASCASS